MTDTTTKTYASRRGTIYYTSKNPIPFPALPSPPCEPRQRRPHSIHITRLPVDFVPLDCRPLPPIEPQPAQACCAQTLLFYKLASRENAKRVLGSIFSSSSNPNASSAAPAATDSSSTSRSSSPAPRPTLSAASTDRNSIYSRRSSVLGFLGANDSVMRRPSLETTASNSTNSTNSINSTNSTSSMNSRNSTSTGRTSVESIGSSAATATTPVPAPGSLKIATDQDKPVCSGSGVTCRIILAEPVIFLTGLDHDGTTRDSAVSTGNVLRGKLHMRVTKAAKIKSINITFSGTARTEWPEGVPPRKVETFEEDSLRHETIPFFNASFPGAEVGYGAMCTYLLRQDTSTSLATNLDHPPSPNSSSFNLPGLGSRVSKFGNSKDTKRLSLQNTPSRSFQKGDSPVGPTPQQRGYKTFQPGIYEYSFDYSLDNNSPETTKLDMASVVWRLEVTVERAGTFKPNLQGFKEIPIIRSPSEDSLELVEPISINRKWEDQLFYDIIISGKSFPLGSKIPIAFKLMPLAKVQVHKLKVYVSQTVEILSKHHGVTRKEPTRKILLLEKAAGKPLAKEYSSSKVKILKGGELSAEERQEARELAQRRRNQHNDPTPLPEPSDNLLGDIDIGLEKYWGATEMEMEVQLPTCEMMEKDKTKRLHHDCTWKNVNVHHWIKIVMRISREDKDNPDKKKRRHFEISIDSPFTILNCRATRENLALPQYSNLNADVQGLQHVCGCPNAATMTNSPRSSVSESTSLHTADGPPETAESFIPSLARPPQAHLAINTAVQRPIHMLRNPSYNPPAFDAEQPPPPMVTPPPLYDHVVGTPSVDGMADYFARLGAYEDEEDHTDDEDSNRSNRKGRVNIANPRTPGGRVHRSMDIDRNFMFNAAALDRLAGSSVGNGSSQLST